MTKEQAHQMSISFVNKIDDFNMSTIKERLEGMDMATAQGILVRMKDPTIGLILSIVVGVYGVDRFYKGDIGLGVLKLITFGGCCIWWLIDLFNVQDDIRNDNMNLFLMYAPEAGPQQEQQATQQEGVPQPTKTGDYEEI